MHILYVFYKAMDSGEDFQTTDSEVVTTTTTTTTTTTGTTTTSTTTTTELDSETTTTTNAVVNTNFILLNFDIVVSKIPLPMEPWLQKFMHGLNTILVTRHISCNLQFVQGNSINENGDVSIPIFDLQHRRLASLVIYVSITLFHLFFFGDFKTFFN